MSDAQTSARAEIADATFTRFNALRHGVLSRYTVLPWEDPHEYDSLLTALVAEHAPQGPTEEHLVEELAGVMWRKRRLRLAEASSWRSGLERTFAPYRDTVKVALVHLDATDQSERVVDAVRASPSDTAEDIAALEMAEDRARRALAALGDKRSDAYRRAVAELQDDTRDWWAGMLARNAKELDEGEAPATADANGLRRFLEEAVLPWFGTHKMELANRHLIREHAFGAALDLNRLEPLCRYEVQLDRKLERMLAMLLRLRDLRQAGPRDDPFGKNRPHPTPARLDGSGNCYDNGCGPADGDGLTSPRVGHN